MATKSNSEKIPTGANKKNDDKSSIEALHKENTLLKKQLKEMKTEIEKLGKMQIIQTNSENEKINFLWQAEVASDNVQTFGDGGMYGRIIGKTGTFTIPKNELSRILTENVRFFLKKRWLIVTDGLTEDERENLGVNYKEGELLDRRAFSKMVDLGEEVLNIYPRLCDGHKMMIAQRYKEAYMAGNKNITRDIVVKLNEMSKTNNNARGDFITIIEDMNKKDLE